MNRKHILQYKNVAWLLSCPDKTFNPHAGTYAAGSLLKQKGGYERLFPDSVNFELINQLPCLKKLVRYDFFIETTDNMKLAYQVFLKDGSFVRDITDVQPYLARSVVPGSPGPGFLLNRTVNLCRFE